uniref:Anti-sigma factor n=1 Tax=Eiseniibacteriota bacterium TaxID=2212470 RepID=A0A832HYW0_UNCEI
MSLRDEQERRIQDMLEGTASPGEAAETRAWLAASAEGRAREQDLRETFAALGALALEEPPAGLTASIMAQVAAEPRRVREPWWAAVSRSFARRPAWGLGYAFAAGVAVGALALGLATGALSPARHADLPVTATLAPPGAAAPGATAALAAGASEVAAALWIHEDLARLRVEGAGREPGTLEIAWDEAACGVLALHWSGAGGRRVESEPGRLSLALGPGARCAIDFEIREATQVAFGVTLRSPSGEIHRELRAGAGGRRR